MLDEVIVRILQNRKLRTLGLIGTSFLLFSTHVSYAQNSNVTKNQATTIVNKEEKEEKIIKLSEIPNPHPGQTQIYLPINGNRTLEESIVIGTGILNTDLIAKIAKELKMDDSRFKEKKPGPEKGKKGILAYVVQGIPKSLKIGEIQLNPETLEAKTYPFIQLETEANLPAFKWRIYQRLDGDRILLGDWPIAIGDLRRKSTVGKFVLDEVQHYPWWTDPEKYHFETRNGKEVMIYDKRIKPGPRNPLGEWKLLDHRYEGDWYFHGTNEEWKLKREKRAISHGCHRNLNSNIAYLAGFFLSRYSDRLFVFDQPLSKNTTKVRLNIPIPTVKKYDTIEVFAAEKPEESYVVFYPNVYGYDIENEFIKLTNYEHLRQDLEEAGFKEENLKVNELRALVKKAAKTGKVMEVKLTGYLAL